jgi:hypothetical protein
MTLGIRKDMSMYKRLIRRPFRIYTSAPLLQDIYRHVVLSSAPLVLILRFNSFGYGTYCALRAGHVLHECMFV